VEQTEASSNVNRAQRISGYFTAGINVLTVQGIPAEFHVPWAVDLFMMQQALHNALLE
jgi:hypothetical protein